MTESRTACHSEKLLSSGRVSVGIATIVKIDLEIKAAIPENDNRCAIPSFAGMAAINEVAFCFVLALD